MSGNTGQQASAPHSDGADATGGPLYDWGLASRWKQMKSYFGDLGIASKLANYFDGMRVGWAQSELPLGGLIPVRDENFESAVGRATSLSIGTLYHGLHAGGEGTLGGGMTLGGAATSEFGVGFLAMAGGVALDADAVYETAQTVANAKGAAGAISNAMQMRQSGDNGGESKGEAPVASDRPEYRPNPAHNPKAPLPGKTPEPADAASVYQRAMRTDARTWYGRGANGEIYRFQSDNAGGAHFNGMTGDEGGLRPESIPIEIRRALAPGGR